MRFPPLLAALLLFLVWSNTFVAAGLLVGADHQAARFDWLSLTVARFATIFPVCVGYCLVRWRQSAAVLRAHGGRAALGGLLAVPGYNTALYWGQQHGVPAPIASLTTALLPLFVVALAALFLRERLTARRLVALAVSLTGMGLIALAHRGGEPGEHPAAVAVTALAPLSWALFTVLSKPVSGRVPPLLWTYLCIAIGTAPLMLVLPFRGGPELRALDATGWGALLFLSLLATLVGFAAWTWLLGQLPATTVGLTVFFNPPLTALSKAALAAAAPAVFRFAVAPLEWVGGAVALTGLAIAVLGVRPSAPPPAGTPRSR
ncbi:MAG: DMT family transporter [Thermoanaerobaculia bacterium]|nr:DMT family transporter [Thermoanaerobaculia bacterium]